MLELYFVGYVVFLQHYAFIAAVASATSLLIVSTSCNCRVCVCVCVCVRAHMDTHKHIYTHARHTHWCAYLSQSDGIGK
jgi:hypothetical protein